jgi:hypothetical protein
VFLRLPEGNADETELEGGILLNKYGELMKQTWNGLLTCLICPLWFYISNPPSSSLFIIEFHFANKFLPLSLAFLFLPSLRKHNLVADNINYPLCTVQEANFQRSRCSQSKFQDAMEKDSQEDAPQGFRA